MVSLLPTQLLFNYSIAVFRQGISTVWLCKEIKMTTTNKSLNLKTNMQPSKIFIVTIYQETIQLT